ncbi:hypothetical protein O181_005974 [Austropuccinia psidii MF-1]|uniref:Tc1-like transposase DDE domain-containing protein n=1 Tax=Austropuccinia psidii MF-1 TaxID=1389203 RepID=A0A9Q3BIH9_9BASI|nr:hypothetical protein [Austropuccinia psidii MF-1]
MVILSCTISKEIHNLGKQLCVAPKNPYLCPVNFVHHLAFAQQLHLWNPHQWGHIIWTDECSFELGKKSNQVRVWNTPNKKYELANLQVNHDMGMFCRSTKGLLVFLNGPLNAAAFIEQVFNPALLLFFNNMANAPYIKDCQNIAMMEDRAPIHMAWLPNEWCQANAIANLPWPANSLDLNPIENIWHKMKSHNIKHYSSHTIAELQAAIFAAWNDLPAEFLADLLFKMHEHIQYVIDHNGGPTRW